ncbi:unnamed protein product [Nesidiocoris tenuis]|uniref:Uncharacterized protein n=1 Tax=Nesidiocoris tenuis TaxID=355587 RepID=A0A6H5G7P8_9HEMI|nr:unnamed protein product [Nesidiocoris tenuis]
MEHGRRWLLLLEPAAQSLQRTPRNAMRAEAPLYPRCLYPRYLEPLPECQPEQLRRTARTPSHPRLRCLRAIGASLLVQLFPRPGRVMMYLDRF